MIMSAESASMEVISAQADLPVGRGRARCTVWLPMLLAALPVGAAPSKPAAETAPIISTATVRYAVPAVQLVRDDGKVVSLPEEMNDGRPVVLNFIFTSCSSICPLMSQVFAQFQQRLGAESATVHLMSISVDPEEDTPARLREYARKFHAGAGWQHYTGTIEASLAAQRAFNVWRGDKMSHSSVTFMRVGPDAPWLRIDGFVTPDELLQRYHQLRASSQSKPGPQSLAVR
jgi:protein SCO1/2